MWRNIFGVATGLVYARDIQEGKQIKRSVMGRKFKVGQHICLKDYPRTDIEIVDVTEDGYVIIGGKYDSNGAYTYKGCKTIPFKYENDYAIKKDCVEVDDSVR